MDYLHTHEVKKLLCTYDSMKRLKQILGGTFEGYRIVVDEFHCILQDSSFKARSERSMLDALADASYVTWMSATPNLDYFLENIPEFRPLPYYQLNWADRQPVCIQRQTCARPVDAAIRITHDYQEGRYPFIERDGQRIDSTEAVIFLNSVNNIVNLISQCALSPEDVNIIVSDNDENRAVIQKLGEGFTIGKAPLRGEPHKMITLCTSIAYMGVDFYSTSATTFVISDCHRCNTAVSIETELPQIIGRQRLQSNPFRNQVFFIYNTWNGEKDIDSIMAELEEKKKVSEEEIKAFREAGPRFRSMYVKMKGKVNLSYATYNEVTDQMEMDYLSQLSDEYEMRVQYSTYNNGAYVFRNLSEQDMIEVSESATYITVSEHVRNTICKTTFSELLETYCQYRQQKEQGHMVMNLMIPDIERSHPDFRTYYDELGYSRLRSLSFTESRIKEALRIKSSTVLAMSQLQKAFPVGTELTASDYKQRMNAIFASLNMKKAGKVKDLTDIYGFQILVHNRNEQGRRQRTYEIISTPNFNKHKEL